MAIYKNNTEVKDIYMVGHGLLDPNAVGLQEDVDYVRYEWLVGDGAAYIDTLVKNLTNVHSIYILISVDGVSSETNMFFGREAVVPYYNTRVVLYYVPTRQNISVWGSKDGHEVNFGGGVGNITLNLDTNIASTLTDSVEISTIKYSSAFSIYLFAENNNGSAISPFTGKIKKLEIDNILHLVPCRLLHSIPASLDANNKARQEGEYGMIDLVSRKFYGNVNNSGSFTGEGLIQKKVTFAFFNGKHVFGEMQEGVHIRRYGWLKGDGAAYITHKDVDAFEVKVLELNNSGASYAYGYYKNNSTITSYLYIGKGASSNNSNYSGLWLNVKTGQIANYRTSRLNLGLGEHIITKTAETGQIGVFTDGVRHIKNAKTDNDYVGTDIIFNRLKPTQNIYIGYLSSPNIHNLVPCKLLRPIPAELDANGIARAAGSAGMYDEVSHKFYGNVGSGTFTVEGMADGYDYEVYTYLKGTGGCYIDTLINPAWNDQLSATTEVSGRPTVLNPSILNAHGTNTRVEIMLGGAWYKDNTTQFLVFNKVEGTNDYIMFTGFPANAELYCSFKVVNNSRPTVSFKVNGAAWNVNINNSNIITELPDTTYKIGRDTANGLDVLKLKNVKINSHNFMPCKLLRAIPAELDANGIARNAEECGMVDTYSGLFYGNVNSSGTFSVSNS